MKKVFVILFVTLLAVIFYGQIKMEYCTVHSLINTETIETEFVQIEDNCQEDIMTNINSRIILKPLLVCLVRSVQINLLSEHLFICLPPK
jgi:hypothetical protein